MCGVGIGRQAEGQVTGSTGKNVWFKLPMGSIPSDVNRYRIMQSANLYPHNLIEKRDNMGIWITGDTHGDIERFSMKNFPEQKNMTKEDFVIILGDFGLVWEYSKDNPRENYWLNWLSKKPFTTLFIDGNHENYDRLKKFPVVDYHGGKAHKIRDNVYHLMRGYIFDLCGKKFFAFGGASSHDIQDGILNIEDYKDLGTMVKDYNRRTRKGQMLRINHISWWKEELPSRYEMDRGRLNLSKSNYMVDYVITHCPPKDVCNWCGYYDSDIIISYFENLIKKGLEFKEWWSGHFHTVKYNIYGKYNVLYKDINRII